MRKRDLLILLAALTAAAVTAVGIFSGSALPTGAWGLSFRQEGAPPIGNAGVDQLKRYDAAYIGSTSEKVLYLTFDAGYENGCTEKILDTLQKHNVKAAFFLVGNYIEKNADLVRRMTEEGHIVGNHTMHHYDIAPAIKNHKKNFSIHICYYLFSARKDTKSLPLFVLIIMFYLILHIGI